MRRPRVVLFLSRAIVLAQFDPDRISVRVYDPSGAVARAPWRGSAGNVWSESIAMNSSRVWGTTTKSFGLR